MKTRTSIRRVATSAAGLAAALALVSSPAHAAGGPSPSTDTNVIRSPQVVMVLADGESGCKRPV
jgi:hypothetical protein